MALADAIKKNDYAHTTVVDHGKRSVVLRVFCSTCNNTTDAKLGPSTNQDIANRSFRNKKWRIGKDRRHDVCPDCQAAELEAKRVKREESEDAVMVKTVEAETLAYKTAPESEFDKLLAEFLRDVLEQRKDLPEFVTYKEGWKDQRVVDEMKSLIPDIDRHRVMAARHKFFGPARRARGTLVELAKNKKAPAATKKALVHVPEPKPVVLIASPEDKSIGLRLQQVESFMKAMSERVSELGDDVDGLHDSHERDHKILAEQVDRHNQLSNKVYDVSELMKSVEKIARVEKAFTELVKSLLS